MRSLLALAVLGFFAGAALGETLALPNPAACTDYLTNGTGAAGADCDAAIARETDAKAKSVLLFRRAYIETTPGDYDKYPTALTDLDAAITLYPGNWMARRERAYLYNEYGRWADAAADLDRSIPLDPTETGSYRERALSRFKLGNLAGSYDDRVTVVQLGGTGALDLLNRAEAAMWTGRLVQAANDIDAAEQAAGATDNGHVTKLAAALRAKLKLWATNSGEATAAKACAASDDLPQPPDANLIGDCTLAFLTATTPKDRADALTRRAAGWLAAQDQDTSVDDFEIAAALDPTAANLSNLGFGYMQMHHSTVAVEVFDRSIALNPHFVAYAGRAAAKSNLGDLDGAEADAIKSNQLQPNEIAYTVLGDVAYARTKTYDKAKDFWLAAYKLGDRDDGLIGRLKKAGVPIPPPDAGTSP